MNELFNIAMLSFPIMSFLRCRSIRETIFTLVCLHCGCYGYEHHHMHNVVTTAPEFGRKVSHLAHTLFALSPVQPRFAGHVSAGKQLSRLMKQRRPMITASSKGDLLTLDHEPKPQEHKKIHDSIELANGKSEDFEDRTRLGTLEVSSMGVGTISWGLRGFGGLVDGIERTFLTSSNAVNTAEPVLLASALAGIDLFDTAERYGNSFSTAFGLGYGETEKLLERTIRESGVQKSQKKVIVATKFTPSPFRTTAESVVAACEASRQRLGVDVIDLYQIQIPDIVQPWARVSFAPKEWSAPKDEIYWEGMVECYKRGIIANVGVSNYGPKLLRRAYEYFKSKGVPLVSNQINYSLLYRKKGAQKTVDTCNELGIKVLAYFPLAMGLLTGKWKSNSASQSYEEGSAKEALGVADTLFSSNSGVGPVGEPLNPGLTGKSTLEQTDIAKLAQRAVPLLEVLETIAQKRNKSVPQVALNWVICKGAIPIPGARTAGQVMDNKGAMGWRLTPDEVKRLEDAADRADIEFSGAGFKRSNSKFVGYGFETWSLED